MAVTSTSLQRMTLVLAARLAPNRVVVAADRAATEDRILTAGVAVDTEDPDTDFHSTLGRVAVSSHPAFF
jgi:hypothetical protein